jgi:hypothetical protein
MHPWLRTGLVVAIVAVTALLVFKILFGGPDPQTGRCVDTHNDLVDCDARAAIFKLVRKVDAARDCPADARKLYQFKSDLFCGVALHGAPAVSPEYVSCLLLAGARLASTPADLSFAAKASNPGRVRSSRGAVTVTGDDWRIFYVLAEGQLDPGAPAIVANPARAIFVAYIDDAAARAKDVAAAERCVPGAAAAAN